MFTKYVSLHEILKKIMWLFVTTVYVTSLLSKGRTWLNQARIWSLEISNHFHLQWRMRFISTYAALIQGGCDNNLNPVKHKSSLISSPSVHPCRGLGPLTSVVMGLITIFPTLELSFPVIVTFNIPPNLYPSCWPFSRSTSFSY